VELVEAQQSIEELKTQLAATTELLNTVTHGDTIEDPGSGDPE
jgi:hypothetical protein